MRGSLPGLIHYDQSCHIPDQSWGWALMASQRIHQWCPRVPKICQEFWSAAPQGWKTRKFLCVRKNFPRSVASIVECPFVLGSDHGPPIDPGRIPSPRGARRELPGDIPSTEGGAEGVSTFFQCLRGRSGTFYSQKSPRKGRNLPNCRIIRLRGGGLQDEQAPKPQSRQALVPEPVSFLKPRPRTIENSVENLFHS